MHAYVHLDILSYIHPLILMCLLLEYIQSHHTLLTRMADAKALSLKRVSGKASIYPDTNRLCSVHVGDQQS